MTHSLAILGTAILFGGMTLYSFGFAAILFKALPAREAGATLRQAFPWFYLFVLLVSAVSGLLWWSHDPVAAATLMLVAVTTLPLRQVLMPAINRATDTGDRRRFKWLHGASVVVTLCHIAASGWLLTRLV